jgi:hypothetical protein
MMRAVSSVTESTGVDLLGGPMPLLVFFSSVKSAAIPQRLYGTCKIPATFVPHPTIGID